MCKKIKFHAWLILRRYAEKLSKAKDLEEVRRLHDWYLDTVKDRCLLTVRRCQQSNPLRRVFSLHSLHTRVWGLLQTLYEGRPASTPAADRLAIVPLPVVRRNNKARLPLHAHVLAAPTARANLSAA